MKPKLQATALPTRARAYCTYPDAAATAPPHGAALAPPPRSSPPSSPPGPLSLRCHSTTRRIASRCAAAAAAAAALQLQALCRRYHSALPPAYRSYSHVPSSPWPVHFIAPTEFFFLAISRERAQGCLGPRTSAPSRTLSPPSAQSPKVRTTLEVRVIVTWNVQFGCCS
jgi:hypothetical protein